MAKKSNDPFIELISGIISIIGGIITSCVSLFNNKNSNATRMSISTKHDLEDHEYDIKGMNYQNFNRKLRSDFFNGYIKTELDNEFDPCAIAVYNNKDLHLGYLPGGSSEIFDKLNKEYNGTHYIFGFVKYDRYDKYWFGKVFIPIELSEKEIKKYQSVFFDAHRRIFVDN